jgi:actin-related protein 3
VVVKMAFKGQPLVIDVGTGYTKMGFACNNYPTHVIPTVLGARATVLGTNITKKPLDELDFLIGKESIANNTQYPPKHFLKHGLVTNWDLMEKFYEQIFWKYLRVNPEDQPILVVCNFKYIC